MDLPQLTLVVFYAFNALRLGAYLPQIIRVANDKDGAKAISYTTWSVWIGANGSTAEAARRRFGRRIAHRLVFFRRWCLWLLFKWITFAVACIEGRRRRDGEHDCTDGE